MPLLREPVVMIAVITISTIAVALVTFGILDSTAALNNTVWSIGGAAAFALAWGGLLVRSFKPRPSVERIPDPVPTDEGPIVVQDALKFLDVTDPPTKERQEAQLIEYYRLTRNSPDAGFWRRYATSGEIEWLGSDGHKNVPDFKEVPLGEHRFAIGGGQPKREFKREYRLEVDLAAGEAHPELVTRVKYTDAFCGLEKETIETEIVFPTRRIEFLIHLPDSMHCTGANGYRRVALGKEELVSPGPFVMHDGRLIYWPIGSPEKGHGYGVEWTWEPR